MMTEVKKQTVKLTICTSSIPYGKIKAFRTCNHIGVRLNADIFLLFASTDYEFSPCYIGPKELTFQSLCECVYDECGEWIEQVSDSSSYTFTLDNDD